MPGYKKHKQQTAFSLVELSIVLVILGLLVGGILTGQNLIHAAQLRSVTSEYNSYQTAVNIFKDKYFHLPGDMPNATAFWGKHMPDNYDCQKNPSSGIATCNGDGNGRFSAIAANLQGNEEFRFWHHLYNAGLIEFLTYGNGGDGTLSNNNSHVCIGGNVPASKWNPAGWHVRTYSAGTDVPKSGNLYIFGTRNTCESAGGQENGNPVMSPVDAYNIDTKIDDGMAFSGRIIGRNHSNCRNGDDYRLDRSSTDCMLFFMIE